MNRKTVFMIGVVMIVVGVVSAINLFLESDSVPEEAVTATESGY